MKLYHNPMSSCSQKVRLVLAEKKLPYESEILDLQKGAQFSEEYLRLKPDGRDAAEVRAMLRSLE